MVWKVGATIAWPSGPSGTLSSTCQRCSILGMGKVTTTSIWRPRAIRTSFSSWFMTANGGRPSETAPSHLAHGAIARPRLRARKTRWTPSGSGSSNVPRMQPPWEEPSGAVAARVTKHARARRARRGVRARVLRHARSTHPVPPRSRGPPGTCSCAFFPFILI